MTDYRAYVIGPDGSFESCRAFVSDSDEEAIVWAQQMMNNLPVELWSGTRRVQRLSPKDNGQAVTHEVHEGRLVPKGKE